MPGGVWLVVDEDGRGEALRQAVASQARLQAVSDPFSARRILGSEAVAGLLLCVGKRTLSLRSLCSHVRQTLPALIIIAVRHPGQADDADLVGLVDGVIDDGTIDELLAGLARLTPVFQANEPTMVLPPPTRPPATVEHSGDDETVESTTVSAAPDLPDDANTETLVVPAGSSLDELRETLEGTGPEVLLRIAGARRSGRLLVADGEGAGALEFHLGEPVAADPATGDGGLYRRLLADGLLQPGQVPDTLPKGRLLGALVTVGVLTEAQVRDFSRGILREQIVGLCRQSALRAVFVESSVRTTTTTPTTTTTAPAGSPPRLNIFGLIVDARRRSVSPEVLDALFGEIAGWQLTATPLLARVAFLVTPFTGGRDIGPLLNGGSAHQFLLSLDLHRSMGSLLLLALRDAGLLTASEAPASEAPSFTAPSFTAPPLATGVLVPEVPTPSRVLASPARGISPRMLLGTGMAPDEDEIEAAWAGHVARIGEELARATTDDEREALDGMRQRLDIARQALRLQLGFATSVNRSNPFG